MFYGHECIENLSPFVLLDEDAEPLERDVQAILELMKETAPGRPGYPREQAIEKGLTHPNQRVQEIAKKMNVNTEVAGAN